VRFDRRRNGKVAGSRMCGRSRALRVLHYCVPSVTRRIEKKVRKAEESSQAIASCGNGLPKYLSFQVKR
jgi:hypothetical protein